MPGKTIKMVLLSMMVMSAAGRAYAVEQNNVETSTQSFSVTLGATRVIYDPDSAGATLTVINPQDYPMLVQSRVYEEDKKTAAPVVVTPPLFRLDGKQQSRLKIVRTGGDLPKDRESLDWLCVTGIPPKADDVWAKENGRKKKDKVVSLNVQLSISSCLKLLFRPSSIKGGPETVASTITWRRDGKSVKVVNPTPYYISLAEVKVGGVPLAVDYVPAFGSRSFTLPKSSQGGNVEWHVINDYGGKSQVYRASLR